MIGDPQPRVFDFVRNESVDITAITGGNPLLLADSRHVFNARREHQAVHQDQPQHQRGL